MIVFVLQDLLLVPPLSDSAMVSTLYEATRELHHVAVASGVDEAQATGAATKKRQKMKTRDFGRRVTTRKDR
jgi:hypothetical protein